MPDERDNPMEIGLGASLAVLTGPPDARVVVVVHLEASDPPGVFRVRRGANVQEAYAAPVEQLRPPAGADASQWADLADTGIQVKINSMRGMTRPPGVAVGDLRVGIRRLEDVDA
jgi:hypothetical protein